MIWGRVFLERSVLL